MVTHDNLPEHMQYLDLLRDVRQEPDPVRVHVPSLPRNVVRTHHVASGRGYKSHESTMKNIRLHAPLTVRQLQDWAGRVRTRGCFAKALELEKQADDQEREKQQAKRLKEAVGEQGNVGLDSTVMLTIGDESETHSEEESGEEEAAGETSSGETEEEED